MPNALREDLDSHFFHTKTWVGGSNKCFGLLRGRFLTHVTETWIFNPVTGLVQAALNSRNRLMRFSEPVSGFEGDFLAQ